jgi:hypothetical protein
MLETRNHALIPKRRGLQRDVERTQQQRNLSRRARRDHTAKDQHDSGKRDFRDKTPWLILHIMSSTAQALLLDEFTTLQTFQSLSTLSLSHSKFLQQRLDYNYQAQRRKSGIRPRSPSYRSFTIAMSIKIQPFYPLQIHRCPQKLSS